MLAVISPLISRGVIDNTRRELIDLRLWCIDGQEPLHFRMPGNCLRDIAGCRVSFRNNAAFPKTENLPAPIGKLRRDHLRITPGDITLSRRAPEQNNRSALTNYLSLEFFVNDAMRILVETSDFSYELSLPLWQGSEEDDLVQRQVNREALRRHVAVNVADYRAPIIAQLGDLPPCDWDDKLNRAEAYMNIYPTVRDKYIHERDGYISAAYVLDCLHILNRAAESDEKNLPPHLAETPRDFQIFDFLSQNDAEAVQKAMQSPLFREASRMTAVVQKIIIQGEERVRSSKEAAAFTSGYAGLVSHILATILLTQQGAYPTGVATARLGILGKRLRALPQLCQTMPEKVCTVIQQAARRLLQALNDFRETIPH